MALVGERDECIEAALEEHTEKKFLKLQTTKKKFMLKLKLAEKNQETGKEQVALLEAQQKDELAKIEE